MDTFKGSTYYFSRIGIGIRVYDDYIHRSSGSFDGVPYITFSCGQKRWSSNARCEDAPGIPMQLLRSREVSSGHPFDNACIQTSVMSQPPRPRELSCGHPFDSAITLASVIVWQKLRLRVVSFLHLFDNAITLASVILL